MTNNSDLQHLPFSTNLLDMAYVMIPNKDYTNGSADADYEMADAIQLEVGAV